jgi:uncharacterized protein (TIGR02145 family)
MNKLVFTLTLFTSLTLASEVVWDGKVKLLTPQEIQKALEIYTQKTYPQKWKEWKKEKEKEKERKKLYALSHPKDKYGNEYGVVKSPYTGKVWLDRNLGASRVCQSYDDEQCYGDYFQWGRESDGHEKKNSSNFKTGSSDWMSSDSSGAKRSANWNPCPKGFRVPTIDELLAETTKQRVRDRNDAYRNFLKLPSAGYRYRIDGSLFYQGSRGYVWSSSPGGSYSQYLHFSSSGADSYDYRRASGLSVRCLRD